MCYEYVGQADFQTNSKEIFVAPSIQSRFPTKISLELVLSNHIPFHILTNFEYINSCLIEKMLGCEPQCAKKLSFQLQKNLTKAKMYDTILTCKPPGSGN